MDAILESVEKTPEKRRSDLLHQVDTLRVQAEADLRKEFSGYPAVVIILCNTLEHLIKEAEQDSRLLDIRKENLCIHNPG